ncbi:MAG: nucleotidyltransferase domain-containing protein [Methanotrichaceae archaeon]|nr:nucleotidyltransferase domain-containing protein [Methanotrichaceae archaeon]
MNWMNKFVGLKVVEYFLSHPSKEIYLKELARELEISPASAKAYCDDLLAEGLILENLRGNLRLFRSNRDDFAFKETMKAYHLIRIKHLGIETLAENCTSLAIYGSFAAGNFDEQSDLDLLVIGEESDVDRDRILDFQEAFGRDIQLTVLPYYKWETLKKDADKFAESVLRDHILISGIQL